MIQIPTKEQIQRGVDCLMLKQGSYISLARECLNCEVNNEYGNLRCVGYTARTLYYECKHCGAEYKQMYKPIRRKYSMDYQKDELKEI
jgi:hypothetical protein